MKAKAKAIYEEYKREFVFFNRYQRNGFIRRLRNLAKRIDVDGDPDNIAASIYLDHIALWLDLDLEFLA